MNGGFPVEKTPGTLVVFLVEPGVTRIELVSRCVGLQDAEGVALRILAVSQVADAGNHHLRRNHFAAGGLDVLYGFIERRGVDGVDRAGARKAAAQYPAVDAWRVGARGNEPIVLRTLPFVDFPAKYLAIEHRGTIGIVRGNFKVNDSRHERYSP